MSVLGSMIVLSMFVLAALAFTLQQVPAARRDQDAQPALASAEAGIED